MLITEIAAIQSDSQTLVDQLNLCLVLERQQKELIDYMNKQNQNAMIYSEIITPLPGLMLMTYGFIEMGCGNTDFGWNFVKAGAITLVGMELIYNGSHWVFKIW